MRQRYGSQQLAFTLPHLPLLWPVWGTSKDGQAMTLLNCVECQVLFEAYTWRSVRCKACQSARVAQMKLDSQSKRTVKRKQQRELVADISSEEIESRFTAALKEAKRAHHGLEPFRSYGWLYREPRS